MFYQRLKAACDLRNIAISRAVQDTLPSVGVVDNWKKGGMPRVDAVIKLANYLGVTADFLLELTDNPFPVSSSARDLDENEAALIDRLRMADSCTYDHVIKMASSILPNELRPAILSCKNDGISNHANRKETSKEREFHKRIEGAAAAGVPITAVPDGDSFVSVPEKYLDERYFIVRARGKSMEDTIPDGACCVFQRDAFIDDGVIALVQIDGATDQPDDTIKRVYRKGHQVELRSDNPEFDSMLYPVNAVQIAGVLVDVLPVGQH